MLLTLGSTAGTGASGGDGTSPMCDREGKMPGEPAVSARTDAARAAAPSRAALLSRSCACRGENESYSRRLRLEPLDAA
jgi:hypothetical protein